MKKAILAALLIPLLVFEIYLCTVFLPLRWQHQIDGAIVHLMPEKHDWTLITHPTLGQEIEQVLSEHIWLRVSLYVVTLLLLTVNAWAIYRLVRLLRSERYVQESA